MNSEAPLLSILSRNTFLQVTAPQIERDLPGFQNLAGRGGGNMSA
jgi:hypothetical protein